MKKSRRHCHNTSSDISEDDRHAHKYSKHAVRAHEKDLTGKTASHDNSEGRGRPSHRHVDDVDSGSSDEVLIKHRSSRRFPRGRSRISRQVEEIEKDQREALECPSSSSSKEIHVHYIPIVTNSSSPPISSRHSRSSAAFNADAYATRKSKSQGISASEVTSELKGMTMSRTTERDLHKKLKRSKHEKRGKHGKKKDPLEQRWICYQCGKLRSDKIQERHPLHGGKMQPNWCGHCRISNELKGKPLDWYGQRHYCWGCGIVRSEKYHRENPVGEDEMSEPNYCKPCREASPSFDRNLREASEVGSEVSVRDKAFQRQVKAAELSDISEDEDLSPTNSAPGKENEVPENFTKPRKTKSFLPKNCALKTKTNSDTSSEGGVPIQRLKAMHLEADRARNSGGGGVRLSAGSYKAPSVESVNGSSSEVVNGDCDVKMRDVAATGIFEGLGATSKGTELYHGEQHDAASSMSKGCQTDGSPTVLAPNQQSAVGDLTKKVHRSDSRPTTADGKQLHDSDSGFSSLPSDVSLKSAASRGRHRRDPTIFSSGSPLERQSASTKENIGYGVPRASVSSSSAQPPESSGNHHGQGLPSQSTFGDGHKPRRSGSTYTYAPALSEYGAMPPTPPRDEEQHGSGSNGYSQCPQKQSRNACWDSRSFAQSPPQAQAIPNFSRPYQSPNKFRPEASHHDHNESSGPHFGRGYGTRPQYMNQSHTDFDSAAHFSDSASRRDFSGNSYRDPTAEAGVEYTSPHNYDGYPQAEGFNGHNSYAPIPPPAPGQSSSSAFDFSNIGGANDKSSKAEFYSHVPGEREERFTRSFVNAFMSDQYPTEQQKTPSSQPQWHMYDDGDGCEQHEYGHGHAYKSRGDHTTVHRASGGSSGQRVTILSIREITSDEELSPVDLRDGNHDAGSNLEANSTVSTLKPICAD